MQSRETSYNGEGAEALQTRRGHFHNGRFGFETAPLRHRGRAAIVQESFPGEGQAGAGAMKPWKLCAWLRRKQNYNPRAPNAV